MRPQETTSPWAERIDSEEKLMQTVRATAAGDVYTDLRLPEVGDESSTTSWWLRREMYREKVGYYPPATAVLQQLRYYGYCGQYFPHISPSDPSMVAYTPDAQAGAADKQVKTTMGRFLRKFLLLYSDAYIADLESKHRAELDTTFEVARTPEEIETVFTTMVGTSSCMSYKRSHSNFGGGMRRYHPSAVYSGEGLGVAYFRNSKGQIVARSVIYVNPEDPSDKRYVRIYGDAVLKRKLEANGFRIAGLAGAKLPVLFDRDDWKAASWDCNHRVVMPYLDPPGGRGANVEDSAGVWVAWHNGEDFLRVLTREQHRAYNNAGLSAIGAQPTSGSISLTQADISTAIFTCGISGVQVNRLVEAVHTSKVMLETGEVVEALASAATEYHWSLSRVLNGRLVYFKVTEATHSKFTRPRFPGVYNDTATLEYHGWMELDAEIYADLAEEDRLVSSTDTTDLDGRRVLISDTVKVMEADSANFVRKLVRGGDAAKQMRKAGFVSVGIHRGVRRYVHKDNPKVVTTISGRRAVVGYSAIRRRIDGRWDFTRNLTSRVIADVEVHLPSNGDLVGLSYDIETHFQNSPNVLARLTNSLSDEALLKLATTGFHRYGHPHGFAVPTGETTPVQTTGRGQTFSMAEVVAGARWVLDNFSNRETLVSACGYDSAWNWLWANLTVAVVERREAAEQARYAAEIQQAEAMAVDYNDNFEPGSAAGITLRAQQKTLQAAADTFRVAPDATFALAA